MVGQTATPGPYVPPRGELDDWTGLANVLHALSWISNTLESSRLRDERTLLNVDPFTIHGLIHSPLTV